MPEQMTEPGIPFLDRLGEELVAAADRAGSSSGAGRRARGRRPLLLLAAAATLVLVVGAAAVLASVARPDRANADAVRVRHIDQLVEITIVDLEANPKEVAKEIRAAGIDVKVTTVPVGPTDVGRFLSAGGDLPPEFTTTGGDTFSFLGFRLPANFGGHLELTIGRAAKGDEPYAAGTDAYAIGEPLACTGLRGKPGSAVVPVAAALGIRIRFDLRDPVTGVGRIVDAKQVAPADLDRLFIGNAATIARHEIVVDLHQDPQPAVATKPLKPEGPCP